MTDAAVDPSRFESIRRRIDALVEAVGVDTSLGRSADGNAAAVAEVDAIAALVQATWLPPRAAERPRAGGCEGRDHAG